VGSPLVQQVKYREERDIIMMMMMMMIIIIILKYNELIIEVQCMWNVKAKVIPVITGVTGTILKSLRQYLSNIPGKHEIKELQK